MKNTKQTLRTNQTIPGTQVKGTMAMKRQPAPEKEDGGQRADQRDSDIF
jgi:hypothetical protein